MGELLKNKLEQQESNPPLTDRAHIWAYLGEFEFNQGSLLLFAKLSPKKKLILLRRFIRTVLERRLKY